MTKRDFFRIIIKLFGLYSGVLVIFQMIPTYFGYASMQFDLATILLITASVLIIVFLFVALIFKADKIIDWLKLDKGFDDDKIILGNFRGLEILKFSVIIIGGLLMIDNFPAFLNYCYLAFKQEVSVQGIHEGMLIFDQVDYFGFAVAGISILIGYLMVSNYAKLAKMLYGREKGG